MYEIKSFFNTFMMFVFLRRKAMHLVLLLSLVLVLLGKVTSNDEIHPLADEFIDTINERQTLWKAGRNFKESIPMGYIDNLRGCRQNGDKPKPPEFRHDLLDVKIPESFDWRDYYPNCSTIRDIKDQGACGSCWANAAAGVISDRICIHSNGEKNVYISANALISCCHTCGRGCHGGSESDALDYWQRIGIVSGGSYDSNQGCQPYEIPPCEHFINGSRSSCGEKINNTPQCKKTCRDGYSKSYEEDLRFGKSSYRLPNDVKQIQTEIMKNGPVTAAFIVCDDFLHYKSGVYKHTVGNDGGGHAVKVIGWGVENDTPYWLVANSWNSDWGDNGYFKIIRGENHCGIEEFVCGAIPA